MIAYVRTALGDRAGRLLEFFRLKGGQLTDRNYNSSYRFQREKPFTFPGQVVPPLILIRPEELESALSFYEVQVPALQSDRYMQSVHGLDTKKLADKMLYFNYLRNYLLIVKPGGKLIFITDDHNHFPYALTIMDRLARPHLDFSVIHMDEHEDNAVSKDLAHWFKRKGKGRLTPAEVAFACKEYLRINEQLEFACRIGLLKPENINYLLTDHLLPAAPFIHQSSDRKTLPLTNKLRIEDVPQAIVKAKSAGQPVILDYDMDFLFFEHERLFPEVLKKEYRDVSEPAVRRQIGAAAQQSDLIYIATSPDYFNVPRELVLKMIKEIVDAA